MLRCGQNTGYALQDPPPARFAVAANSTEGLNISAFSRKWTTDEQFDAVIGSVVYPTHVDFLVYKVNMPRLQSF